MKTHTVTTHRLLQNGAMTTHAVTTHGLLQNGAITSHMVTICGLLPLGAMTSHAVTTHRLLQRDDFNQLAPAYKHVSSDRPAGCPSTTVV